MTRVDNALSFVAPIYCFVTFPPSMNHSVVVACSDADIHVH